MRWTTVSCAACRVNPGWQGRIAMAFVCAVGLTSCRPVERHARDAPRPGGRTTTAATGHGEDVISVAVAGEHESPVGAMFVLDAPKASFARERSGPQIVIAVWASGRIVWSLDQTKGGPPYLAGMADPARVADTISQIGGARLFGALHADESYVVWDADQAVISIRSAARRQALRSCIELFEANPTLVVTTDGVEALEGRNRADVLAAQPEGHRRFRRVWDEIRGLLSSLVPSRGDPAGVMNFEVRHAGDQDP